MHHIAHLQDGLTPLHTAIRCKDSQSVERLAKERKDKIDQPTKVSLF